MGNNTNRPGPTCGGARPPEGVAMEDPRASNPDYQAFGDPDEGGDAQGAYGYLSRLLKSCTPQCEPLPDLLGLCTQIDNLITGLRKPTMSNLKPSKGAIEAAEDAYREVWAMGTISKALSMNSLEAALKAAYSIDFQDMRYEGMHGRLQRENERLRARASNWESAHQAQKERADYKDMEIADWRLVLEKTQQQLAAYERKVGELTEWKPIETAPKDGSWILLRGESGCINRPYRVHVGCWSKGYLCWQQSEGCSFEDDGGPPTHWMYLAGRTEG